jgi:Phosphotransferase enzyme family
VDCRTVTLVLVDGSGRLVGQLPPFEVPQPWWQDATDVVAGARSAFGIEITVLRLLSAQRTMPPGGAVTYLAECAVPPAEILRVPYDLPPHPLRAPWAQPGGPAASLAWAASRLASLGWEPPVASQQRTWNLSAIWRLDSPSGVAWLKQVPRFFAHEPAVLRWLATVAPERVPRLLAADDGRMLMAHVPGEDRYFAPPAELADLIDDLHSIQRAAPVEPLLAIGVPDKRWPALGRRIRATVAEYGGPPLDQLDDQFAEIDACGLSDTLVHGDFHAGNARSDGHRRTLIDWGDSFVGHPGFDALRIVERQPPDEAARLRAHWAALWRKAVPGSDPERALQLLEPIARLSAAATYAAFVAAIEPSERPYHASDVRTLLDATG